AAHALAPARVGKPANSMTDDLTRARLPRAATPEGQAGLAGVLAAPAHALTGAVAALGRLAAPIGTLAVITGRPVAQAVQLGGLTAVPGIVVLGHYGWDGGRAGEAPSPPSPAGVKAARADLPAVLAAAEAPDGVWVEDKGHALAVHTRRAADPHAARPGRRDPLEALAPRPGLALEPGRRVIELRPPGMDKGVALTELARERGARSILFFGDDLGDLAAFAAVRTLRTLRTQETPGATVVSSAPESELPKDEGDFTVDGPDGVAGFLSALADAVG